LTLEASSLTAAALLGWVALVHLVMAVGVRRGELVWSGRHPRLLPPPLRRQSFYYASLLLVSAWVIAAIGGAVGLAPVPEPWLRSAGWAVSVFLGIAAFVSLARGSTWERFLFTPIAVLGTLLAAYITFA
jgi:hypothetical protein